jgi:hypothetical protein
MSPLCPSFTTQWDSTNKRKLHEKVLWDLVFPRTVFGWLRDMGYSW